MKGTGIAAYLRLDAKTAGCVVEDISEGGLFIRTDRVVAVGTQIALDLVDPEHKKAIKLTGQVVGLILKEAAVRRGVPQGLRIRLDRQAGATREYLQRLMARLGAPQEGSPVFYAVTSQRPRAKVQTEQLRGGGLPVVRRGPPPSLADAPPARTDGSIGPPVLQKVGPEASATRASPLADEEPEFPEEEEWPAPEEEEGDEGAGEDEAWDSSAEGEADDEAAAGWDGEEEPALGDEALSPPRTAPGRDALDELDALLDGSDGFAPGATELGLESPVSRQHGAELSAPSEAQEEAPAEEVEEGDEAPAPPTPDARTVMHDVSAYRALWDQEEAAAPPPSKPLAKERAGDDADEVQLLRTQLELLEQALRGRDERIAELEAALRAARGEEEPKAPSSSRPRRR